MTRTEVSRRRFMQLVGGAVAGAYTLDNIPQARSEAIWRPDRAGNPYRWIGMYTIDNNRIGCGFLIKDDFVLTAAHCLFYPPKRIEGRTSTIFFYPATSGLALSRWTKPYGVFRVTKTLVCPEWKKIWEEYDGTPPQINCAQYDWALLKLERSPGVGNFGTGADVAIGNSISVAGYPNGVSPKNTQQVHSAKVSLLTDSMIGIPGFMGDQWHGMSGGPLFTWQEGLGWCAVGVHSSAGAIGDNSCHLRINGYIDEAIKSYRG